MLRVLLPAALITAVFPLAPPGPSAEPPTAPTAADSSLARTARLIDSVSEDLDRVWPGFWPEERNVLIYREDEAVLLTDGRPPSAWRAVADEDLPSSLEGRLYGRTGELSGLAGNFDMDYRVGALAVAAVPWDGDVFGTLRLLFHEQFHVHQRERFGPTRGSGELGSQAEVSLSPESVSSPGFVAMAEVERRILREAMLSTEREAIRDLLASYLAVRSMRASAAETRAWQAELNVERKEGSAEFVGVTAAALAVGDTAGDRIRKRLRRLLTVAPDSTGQGTSAYAAFRARLYGTGATAAWLLDRIRPGWREALAAGASFPELLREVAGADGADGPELAERALEEHGYAELLARERAEAASRGTEDPVAALLASRPVTVVLDFEFEGPRALARMEAEASGGLPAQPEDGLVVYRNAKTARFAVPGVVTLSAEKTPVMWDLRSAPEVRVTLMLPGLPSIAGADAPDGDARWPDGVRITADGVEVDISASTETRVEGDSVRVRVSP